MRAELKRLYCADWDLKSSFVLDDDTEITIDAFIGPNTDHSSQCFSITICTPGFIQKKVSDGGIFNGRGFLIVDSLDVEKIRLYIKSFCDKCSGNEWIEIEQKLRLLGRSEYEDYH